MAIEVTIPTQRLRYPLPDLALPVRRTVDGGLLTRIANHPEVRPWLGGGLAPLDLSGHCADPRNVALVGDRGGFLCLNLGAGRFDVHTLFEPGTASAEILATMRASLDYVFGATEAETLVTKVAETHAQADILTRRAGFTKLYRAPLSAQDPEYAGYYQLRIEAWAQDSERMRNLGLWFHLQIDHARDAAGVVHAPHAFVAAHDQQVGAAIWLLAHGYESKALCLYNHWAASTGYAPLTLLDGAGTLLDTGDALLDLQPAAMEVLSCR